MALDLSKIIDQVTSMVKHLKSTRDDRMKKIYHAIDVLHSQSNNLEGLAKKIASSKSTWLVAHPVEVVDIHYKPPTIPREFTVFATDGSHIDVDRHQTTHCYLINIGSVVLRYGTHPDAILESLPHLYASEEELRITAPGIKGREQRIEGALLGIKRSVEECRRLAELATNLSVGTTALGLMDGSLILWNLEAYPEFVSDILLEKGFLTYLEQIRQSNNKERQYPQQVMIRRYLPDLPTMAIT